MPYFTRRHPAQRLMRTLMIELLPVMTEPVLLLLQRHEGMTLLQCAFQGAMHPLMAAILFRMSLPDALRSDTQLYQPD